MSVTGFGIAVLLVCPQIFLQYKLKRCLKKECCKQCRYVKYKGTMTKWPVQKLTHGTTITHAQQHDANYVIEMKPDKFVAR